MNKCKHENGWILLDNICIMPDKFGQDYDIRGTFQCNNLDCKAIKRFKFSIDKFEEII